MIGVEWVLWHGMASEDPNPPIAATVWVVEQVLRDRGNAEVAPTADRRAPRAAPGGIIHYPPKPPRFADSPPSQAAPARACGPLEIPY
jgi:hypothetical protein